MLDILYDIPYTIALLGFFHILLLIWNKITTNYYINNKSIWFFLHFIGNFYVVIRTYDAIKFYLGGNLEPVVQSQSEIIIDTRMIVLALHVYHHLLFKLNQEDLFHHVVFVYFGTFISHLYGYHMHWMSLYHLFGSGAPGGIIYLCLVLEDLKLMTKTTRLKIASFLNVWVRSIGLTICWVIRIIQFIHSNKLISDFIFLLVTTLCTIYNGQYYMEQVIRADEKNKSKCNCNKKKSV
jgi:hypothetical protein